MDKSQERSLWLLIGAISLISVIIFRLPGLIFAGVIVILVAGWSHRRRDEDPEILALRSSITLACEDIDDVIGQYRVFCEGEDPDSVADRTLYRPALLETDSEVKEISDFHYHLAAAERFLYRTKAKLSREDLSVKALETLLNVADERNRTLVESWIAARQAARKLGPGH